MLTSDLTAKYISILEEELIPAMGCTEPIALAYASALARKTLGCLPEQTRLSVSANIVKNVKSVMFPTPALSGALKPPLRQALWQEIPSGSWRCSLR